MADAYTTLGIASDPQDAKQEMIDDITARIPGWTCPPGSFTDVILDIVALQHARIGAALEDTALDAYTAYGENIVQEPRTDDEHPFGLVTFTATHTDGVLISAGTALRGSDGAGGEVVFQTTADAIIELGDTTVSGVPVESIDPGRIANAVNGAAIMISAIDGIPANGVTFDGPTTLGSTAETREQYADRLTRRLRLLKAGPVTADEYDLFLRSSIPGVYRVLVRDQYNPADNTSDNPGMLMISMLDESGAWVGPATDLRAAELIEERRETSQTTNIVAPTITDIDVEYSIIVAEGYDPVEVLAESDNAVAAFLSPATWGSPRIGDEPGWTLKNTVRPMGMIGPVIGNVEGVESVESVLAALAGDTPATTPITLPGDAPLTAPGSILGAEA